MLFSRNSILIQKQKENWERKKAENRDSRNNVVFWRKIMKNGCYSLKVDICILHMNLIGYHYPIEKDKGWN